jgi:hypothetical protein
VKGAAFVSNHSAPQVIERPAAAVGRAAEREIERIGDALGAIARFDRKGLWVRTECYVEVWLKMDALAGVIMPITSRYDVPMMVARGYASLSLQHSAASSIGDLEIPAFIHHLGDFDPPRVNAGEKIEETLREIALSADMIADWNLATRPTKETNSRAKGFGDISVELDAIQSNQLHDLVDEAIERHSPATHQLQVPQQAEACERSIQRAMIDRLRDGLGNGPS